ncbi:exodeoxyribonuclease VII large subunit [Oceanihabitans sediminis]|uniref:exodeoxyribonuclease VII large subunit n=1 Tax=Oceanihabitans sediminis TaxID=1812012 RepID=UPI00299E2C4D|nr:exodeoxyribonuclease VII large subunit [Oceanihabitans sediminis]MDX1774008.1 exodeoxyribonuclease VII large subunit [Oceanihabitans sediminis]
MSTLPTYYSLSKILNRVKTIIDDNIAGKDFWLKVEIANINFHRSGHIYLELAENQNGNTIAKCKAIIWSYNVPNIRQSLGENYSNILKKGNEILCYTNIQFDTAYGLSLIITSVNLEFAVGQIEKKRQETIDRLKKEELIDLNKQLQVPLVITSIAVIASKNTSGYQDFIKNIEDNQYGYRYNVEIFSSAVQGNAAENEILNSLKIINQKKYDCVVIIRGGGSKMDLDIFNSYEISKQVSQMQSPVFSGIGHETDITVLDFTANKAFKTPTEVSNFIVNKSYDFEKRIINNYELIFERYKKLIDTKFSDLKLFTEGIANASNSFTRLRRGALHTLMNRIVSNTNLLINKENNKLSLINQDNLQQSKRLVNNQRELLNKHTEVLGYLVDNVINNKRAYLSNALVLIASSSPKTILNKGFSIPRVNGNLYTGQELPKDTIIKLEFKDSVIVTKYVKKENNGK